MKNFYFTYGMNHEDKDGMSLGNMYTEVIAGNENEARDLVEKARGLKWAFCYPADQKEHAVDRWSLTHKTLEEVTLPAGNSFGIRW